MDFLHKIPMKYKYLAMSVILVLLVIILIFTIVHINRNTDATPGQTTVATASTTKKERTSGELSGDSTFLVVCKDTASDSIVFMSLLDFHIYSDNIILTMLSPDTVYNGRTYKECLVYGGTGMLVEAVESVRHCTIDRYAVMNDDGFRGIIDLMGQVPMVVTENYSYHSSDKSYAVNAGENDMEAAMLYTYIKLNSEKPDGMRRVAELLCTVINHYMETADAEDAQTLFGKLCNCVSTDVTVFDYFSCSADIEYLITHRAKCSVFDMN